MGIRKQVSRLFNKRQKEKLEESQNRAKQFLEEYKVIRARYQCDFQAQLELIEGGKGGIVPKIKIIDVTKAVEAEEAAEKLREESKKANENQKPKN